MTAALLLSVVFAPPAGEVRVELGEAVPVNRAAFGVNTSVANRVDADAAGRGDAYDRLATWSGATGFRFPGGTYASLYDLAAGRFYPFETWEPRLGRAAVWFDWTRWVAARLDAAEDRDAFDPTLFARWCEDRGATVSWVLNLATDPRDVPPDAHPAVTLARRLEAEGYPPRFVELGNELEGDSFAGRFPTVDDYLAEIDPLVAAIRAEVPDVEIACPSHVPMADALESDANNVSSGDRTARWAAVTRDRGDGIDLVNHSYLGLRDARRALGLKSYVAWVRAAKGDPAATAEFLAQSPARLAAAARDRLAGSGKRVWMTEWNLWTVPGDAGGWDALAGSPAHGLYVAGWLLEMAADSDTFRIAHLHNLSQAMFGLATLEGGDGEPAEVRAFAPGQLFARLAALARRGGTVAPLTVRGPAGGGWDLDGRLIWDDPTPAVTGAVFASGRGATVVLLNASRRALTLPAGAMRAIGAPTAGRAFAAGADPLVPVSATIPAGAAPGEGGPLTPRPLNVAGPVELPAFSLVELEFAAPGRPR